MASSLIGVQLSMTALFLSLVPPLKCQESTVKGTVGEAVELPCDVDVESCGQVYFITWTKNVSNEWKRLYLYSDTVEKPLQELANPDRADFYLKESTAHLKISPLKIEDEGSYKCDVTYVRGKCPSLSYAHLVMYARPNPPIIIHGGREYRNGSGVGPFSEGTTVVFHCTTIGGKPTPVITWWKGKENVSDKSTSSESDIGISNVTSTIKLQLMREDLGSKLECRVENEATDTPMMTWIRLDLYVKPFALELEEQPVPVIEGEHVELSCIVDGAKPAATVTWYNGTSIIAMSSSIQEEAMDDGTYRTISHLVLPLTRYDHLKTIHCNALNPVMIESRDNPLTDVVKLQVLYAPSVTIGPSEKITVNESGSVIINCTFDANPSNATEVTWYRDNFEINSNVSYRYRFSNSGTPYLAIKSISRSDAGLYSCAVKNNIGRSKSVNSATVDVMYPPIVRARIVPTEVAENDTNIVSIRCDAIEGNPRVLSLVRWYKDNKLMNEATEKEIRWLNVTRKLTGHYSCQGRNQAGWGNVSNPVYFIVNYRPGKAQLIHSDYPAVKGKPTTLRCVVVDLGSPEATTFHWEHNGQVLSVSTVNYTIDRVSLNSTGNYSCAAKNQLDIGQLGYYTLRPKAPPAFIEKPPEEYGANQNDSSISIPCRVECDPLCEIKWLKNGALITNTDMYVIKSTKHPEEVNRNRFQSVVSTLSWNLTAWPGGILDRDLDNGFYSCTSSANDVGHGVETKTYFRVEYPPENITLSNYELSVVEGHVYAVVNCSAHSWPKSSYRWKLRDTIIADTPTLVLNYTIPRNNRGIYVCIASNRHGEVYAELTVNVLYKPDCILSERLSDDGRPTFTCESIANPPTVTFVWYRQNETLHENIISKGMKSILTLAANKAEYDGDYFCKVNNSVGESELCHVLIKTAPESARWIPELTEENVILIAGVVSAIVIATIIVAVVIALVLRNRRTHTGSKPNLEKRENPEGRVQPPDSTPVNKSGQHPNRCAPVKPSDTNNPTKGKAGGSKPVYQNVTTERKKESPSITENTAKYENMTFHHQKDPRRTNPEGVVYADLMLPNHGRSLVGRKGSCTEYATLKFEKEENGTPESLQCRRQ